MKKLRKNECQRRKYPDKKFPHWIVTKFDPVLMIYMSCILKQNVTSKYRKCEKLNQKNRNNNFICQRNKLNIFVVVEEIETHRLLKSGRKSKKNQTFYLRICMTTLFIPSQEIRLLKYEGRWILLDDLCNNI